MVMLTAFANAAELRAVGSLGVNEPYTGLVPTSEIASRHKEVSIWASPNDVAERFASAGFVTRSVLFTVGRPGTAEDMHVVRKRDAAK